MPRILLAAISFAAVLACFALIFWYLVHPESWNWRSRGELLAESATSPAEPTLIQARVSNEALAATGRNATTALRSAEPSGSALGIREELMPAACSLPETVSVTHGAGAAIYSWRDERSVYNFSAEPPRVPTVAVRTINYWTDPEYFDLDVAYRGVDAIPAFRNDLVRDATGIYKVLARLVGENNLRKVALNVVIYPDRATYLQYANSTTRRNMESSSGFYTTRTNEAVTYIHAQAEATLDTARHEATHVIVTGILGLVPSWLNEGLAEYFSRLNVVGQVERVTADEAALQLARSSLRGGSPPLRDFLTLGPDEWRGVDQRTHYALAGGLLFFMMGSDERRRVLSALLGTTAAQYCRQLDTNALLDEFYPGGITALEKDFSDWLRDDGAKAPHDF